ncbi:MAG TPA: glycosyltransferase [Myxococcales bacterium]|nr:glycosyltransferase [Myxococcales bacterium]
MELVPVYLLILLVITNRYVLGPLLHGSRGRWADQTDDSYEPAVAIVIPLFNEGAGIRDTVLSLLEQDYPPGKLEIVVVDDCSTDDSHAWACRAAEGRANVRVLRNPRNQGKRAAINLAVRSTRAEIVISVDSDVIADRRAVRELVRRFVSPDIAAVGGRTFVVQPDRSWLTRMLQVKFYFAQEWLKDLERSFRSVMCLTGCLSAYRRSVLMELMPILENRNLAGIPIRYGEDRFLTRQIVKAGYQTVLTLAAFCSTAAPTTLSGYFSQQLRWRRSNLVDMLCGLSHAWKLHPVVAIHYMSQLALLVAYPAIVFHNLITGELWSLIVIHLLAVGGLGVVYWLKTRHLPRELRVSPAAFLPIAVLMPVTYALLTPLALFTLDSGSWETRTQGRTGVSGFE